MKALASRRGRSPPEESREEPKRDQDQTPLLMYMSRGFGEPEDRWQSSQSLAFQKKKEVLLEDRPSFEESARTTRTCSRSTSKGNVVRLY